VFWADRYPAAVEGRREGAVRAAAAAAAAAVCLSAASAARRRRRHRERAHLRAALAENGRLLSIYALPFVLDR